MAKKYLLSFFVLLQFLISADCQAQHLEAKDTYMPSALARLTSPSLNYDNIWSASPSSFAVSKSSVSGELWGGPIYGTGLPADGNFSSISAIDNQRAYVTVTNASGETGNGVYVTNDQGQSWTRQGSAAFTVLSFPNFVHFFDADNGVVVGDYDALGFFEMYTTSDQGNTWIRVPEENIPANPEFECGVNTFFGEVGGRIWFLNGCTSNPRLYYSTDKGNTWGFHSLSEVLEPGSYGMMTFTNPNQGIFYKTVGSDTYLYETLDGGATFSSLPLPGFQAGAGQIAYLPQTNSLAAISGSNLYFSTDKGLSWYLADTAAENLTWLHFRDFTRGFAETASGTIYKFYNDVHLVGKATGSETEVEYPMANAVNVYYYNNELILPDGTYKFRVNRGGNIYSPDFSNASFPTGPALPDGPETVLEGSGYSATFTLQDVFDYTVPPTYRFTKSQITLVAFLDTNGNSFPDIDESFFPYGTFSYSKNGGPVHQIVSNSQVFLPEYDTTATYMINYAIDPELTAEYGTSFTGLTDYHYTVTSPYILIPIHADPTYDVAVSVTTNAPRPASAMVRHLTITNNGSTGVSVNLNYVKDPAVSISLFSNEQGTLSSNAQGISGSVTVGPASSKVIVIHETVPPLPVVSVGQQLHYSASVSMSQTETTLPNNTFDFTETIVAAFDPNCKTESHGPEILTSEFSDSDFLYYTIEFENLGNAAATEVRIIDELDAQLDPSTIRMIQASHQTYTLEKQGNQLVFSFPGIVLPPASENPDAAKGFVQFRIKPFPGVATGDIIPNNASIFFDNNPAVITNTYTTTFVDELGNSENVIPRFVVFPNPATYEVHLDSLSSGCTMNQIRMYDPSGKVVFSETANGISRLTLDVSGFVTGVYFLEVEGNSGTFKTRLILR